MVTEVGLEPTVACEVVLVASIEKLEMARAGWYPLLLLYGPNRRIKGWVASRLPKKVRSDRVEKLD